MTEYELVDNALTYYNAAMAAFAMYITVLAATLLQHLWPESGSIELRYR